MGSVYKPTYTKSDKTTGRRVTRKTARWYIEFTDEKGNRRKEPGFTDKTATEQLLREREREVELALVGIVNRRQNRLDGRRRFGVKGDVVALVRQFRSRDQLATQREVVEDEDFVVLDLVVPVERNLLGVRREEFTGLLLEQLGQIGLQTLSGVDAQDRLIFGSGLRDGEVVEQRAGGHQGLLPTLRNVYGNNCTTSATCSGLSRCLRVMRRYAIPSSDCTS